jgi:hypothetical protein
MAISTEGKIGIGLTLLFGLGGGAVIVAPQQVWIGWTIIAFSLAGLLCLGIYHISSAVAPARAAPRSAKMTVGDTAFFAAAGAAVIAAFTAAMRYKTIPVVFALIACVGVAVDAYDRYLNPPILPSTLITGVSSFPPHNYTMDVNTAPLLKYKSGFKLLLITRVVYMDRDKMTDKAIDKSGTYTITGDNPIRMVSVGTGNLRFIPLQTNILEFNLAMIPATISPDSITDLDDVEHVGGKLWGSQVQTTTAGPGDTLPEKKTTP